LLDQTHTLEHLALYSGGDVQNCVGITGLEPGPLGPICHCESVDIERDCLLVIQQVAIIFESMKRCFECLEQQDVCLGKCFRAQPVLPQPSVGHLIC